MAPYRLNEDNSLTQEIALTLSILAVAVVLLVWEILRADLVALLVLVMLAVTGLLEPSEAVSGFSDSAVITVWAVFILSGGLARTGVANQIGQSIIKLGGKSQSRLIALIMLIGGGLSAFMNNIGVAALLLPVVIHISRKTRVPASKLLIPLAFGTLMGGTMTLIGTPANILISEAMIDFNLPSFAFFDYIYLGLPILLGGMVYMVVLGQRLLPDRDHTHKLQQANTEEHFELNERFFTLRIPQDSLLAGHSLAESRIGSALKLSVIGIRRDAELQLAPSPTLSLQANDELIVLGRSDWLQELYGGQQIDLQSHHKANGEWTRSVLANMITEDVTVLETRLPRGSKLIGKSIRDVNFRQNYQGNVVAILGEKRRFRTGLQNIVLREGEGLLVHVDRKLIPQLAQSPDLEILHEDVSLIPYVEDRIMEVVIPNQSSLIGKSLAESKLADAFGLSVLAIEREDMVQLVPEARTEVQAGDRLIVEGLQADVLLLKALSGLEISSEEPPALEQLESEHVGFVEVVLSPHSDLTGKTLKEIHFREKYGLNVLAIWRNGKSTRSNLRDFKLRLGDSLLIYGHRDKIRLLSTEEDFLVLSDNLPAEPRHDKSRLATLIMGAVVISAGIGLLPIALAALDGAVLMVLTRCMDMEDAYASINWQSVFLIAGMLPLGIAMQTSGAAEYLAEQVVTLTSPYGSTALLAGMLLLTLLASQVMPNSVVAVLMAPVAINTASGLGISPQALAMVVAIGASSPFLSPVGHASNILIMGPGSYRFSDFIKVGLPLTLIIIAITLLLLPVFWPL